MQAASIVGGIVAVCARGSLVTFMTETEFFVRMMVYGAEIMMVMMAVLYKDG